MFPNIGPTTLESAASRERRILAEISMATEGCGKKAIGREHVVESSSERLERDPPVAVP